MTLVVCVDDRLGMAFNKRRQSRDKAVCEDILRLSASLRLGMNSRSAMLFEGMDANILTGGAELDCDVYFLEFESPSLYATKADKIVLYRWNRHYPSDLKFDLSLAGYEQTEQSEFAGFSHEKITREVYVRG